MASLDPIAEARGLLILRSNLYKKSGMSLTKTLPVCQGHPYLSGAGDPDRHR